jgi:hypothetical protein
MPDMWSEAGRDTSLIRAIRHVGSLQTFAAVTLNVRSGPELTLLIDKMALDAAVR